MTSYVGLITIRMGFFKAQARIKRKLIVTTNRILANRSLTTNKTMRYNRVNLLQKFRWVG